MSETGDIPGPEEPESDQKAAPGDADGKPAAPGQRDQDASQAGTARSAERRDGRAEPKAVRRRPLPPEVRPAAVLRLTVVSQETSGPGKQPAAQQASEPTTQPSHATQPSQAAQQSQMTWAEPLTGRQRLGAALWPPRVTRAQSIVALLLFALGLGLAIQVRSTSDNGVLRGARQEDLVRILSELDARTQRLEDEKRALDTQRSELERSSDQAAEARRQTVQKAQEFGVLAGTVAAQGPGLVLTIRDPAGAVPADELLDTLQELRAAGAEAVQINDVRATAETYFTDAAGGVRIDAQRISQPYVFKIIGNPQDLQPALNIPGGVVQTVEKEQATVSVVASQKIVVDALRSAKQPDYARSSSQ